MVYFKRYQLLGNMLRINIYNAGRSKFEYGKICYIILII